MVPDRKGSNGHARDKGEGGVAFTTPERQRPLHPLSAGVSRQGSTAMVDGVVVNNPAAVAALNVLKQQTAGNRWGPGGALAKRQSQQ